MTKTPEPERSRPQAPLTHRNLPLMLLQARERVIARFRPLFNGDLAAASAAAGRGRFVLRYDGSDSATRALVRQMAPGVEAAYKAMEAQLGADLVRHLVDALDQFNARHDNTGIASQAPP